MAYSREIEKLERQFAENPRRFAAPFADALRKTEEVERALEVIRVGLELNPEYIPGSVILGRCHLDLGDDNAAEAAFSRVLDLDNENVIALKSLADIMERQGRNDEAVSFLTYLLDVDRSNNEARDQLTRIQAASPSTPAAARPVEPASASPAASTAAPDPVFGAPPGDTTPIDPPRVEEFLEPTALWEPPVGVSEASISSWVEPTSTERDEPPSLGASLLDSPLEADDSEPVEGFESVGLEGPAAYEEFVLEREEEIVLTSMSGAEYQVANDSEALFGTPETPPPAAPPKDPVEDPEPDPEPVMADTAAEPVLEDSDGVYRAEAGSPVSEIAAEIETREVAEEPVEASVEDDETPGEWAMHVGEEREFVPAEPKHAGGHAPDSFDAAIEGIAPVEEAEGADEGVSEPETPVLMVTESMAELYAAQGHPSEALGVYRILFDRNPDNERLRVRIRDLEAVLEAQLREEAAPSYAASVTGGKPVASFLGDMLGARPAKVDLPEPPPPPEPPVSAEGREQGDEEAVASGAPTRPAIDRVSLGAIFGEDPSPVPPADNTATADKPDGAGGFSFDEFFGGEDKVATGRTSAGSVRATRASDDEDDLDQFHSWLQSLKR